MPESRPIHQQHARNARLERERAADALAAMKALQVQMREEAYERLFNSKPPEPA